MNSVYVNCPEFENKRFKLRFISIDDCYDLLKVYSDKKAVPLFNSDNCNGDDFYYTTSERINALNKLNFLPTENKLIGHDGTEYSSYYYKIL